MTRVLQILLVGVLVVGVWRGDVGVLVNAGIALGVTFLPGVLERDLEIPMDAGLTLWLTSAVFFHALGTVGIPGTGLQSFYQSVGWWDHMTHALSASVVAGVGYTVVRALDIHTAEIELPAQFTFVFVVLFVVAFGVVWEGIEFGVTELSSLIGGSSVLTQYGLDDTMLDLVFNALGGVLVATWGTAHLTDVVGAVVARLETPRTE